MMLGDGIANGQTSRRRSLSQRSWLFGNLARCFWRLRQSDRHQVGVNRHLFAGHGVQGKAALTVIRPGALVITTKLMMVR